MGYTTQLKNGFYRICNDGGKELAIADLRLKEADGFAFKNLSGEAIPGGRLPMLLPASMETVERHCEDVADDMEVYLDACGNRYDYGFGLEKLQ